jgi:hypothetical protein
MAQQPLVIQDLLIIDASRLHSETPHGAGLLWTSDQPDGETSTGQHSQQTAIHAPARFELPIPASERPQTHALDRLRRISRRTRKIKNWKDRSKIGADCEKFINEAKVLIGL